MDKWHLRLAVMTGGLLALLVVVLWGILDVREDGHVERAARMAAEGAALLIEKDIQGRLADLSRMARRWRVRRRLSRQEWEDDVMAYMTDHPGLRAIARIDESDRIRWIVPWEGTEKAHGIHLGFEPERQRILAYAREQRRPVLSRIVQLLDGHKGLLALVPIEEETGFAGDFLAVFRLREWLDTVFGNFPVAAISLSVLHEDRIIYQMKARGHAGTDAPVVESEVDLVEYRWRLRAVPTAEFEAKIRSPHPTVVLVGGLVLAVLTGVAVGLSVLARQSASGLSALNGELQRRILAQEEAEKSLRESEAQFRLLSQASPSMIFRTNAKGGVVYVNEQFQRITGLDANRWNGEGWINLTHPDDRERVYRRRKHTVKAGAPWQEEYRLLRPDGRTIWLLELAVPIRDNTGNITGYIGTGTEITARKHAEDALREERDFNRRLVETAPMIVLVLDNEGRIVHFNRFLAQLTGQRLQEVKGRDFFSTFLPPRERERIEGVFQEALGRHDTSGTVNAVLVAEGEDRLIEWYNTDLSDEKERVIGVLAIGRDITALKKAEQDAERLRAELAHAVRVTSLGEMATGLAHEVNQPLAAITNYCELARDMVRAEDGLPEDLAYALEQAVIQAHRAGDIVTSIRNFLRRGDLDLSRLELDAVAREALLVITAEARDKGVHTGLDLAKNLPAVNGNRLQLVQVLVNLLLNGIEAMALANSRPKEIVVRAAVNGQRNILVTVQDTGPGLDPEREKSLFDAFETDKADGMGMGLAICRTIVEAHGGTIWAGVRKTGGAEFSFTLPAAGMGEQ